MQACILLLSLPEVKAVYLQPFKPSDFGYHKTKVGLSLAPFRSVTALLSITGARAPSLSAGICMLHSLSSMLWFHPVQIDCKMGVCASVALHLPVEVYVY